jgi:cytochrome c-type biogenesis protein CcmH/NrfF
MSQEELAAIEIAFRKQRQLEETKREDFLDRLQETVEAEEKAELNQRIRDLECENESLRDSGQENAESASREEFERDLILADAAEVVRDMLAEEETEHESAVEEDECE